MRTSIARNLSIFMLTVYACGAGLPALSMSAPNRTEQSTTDLDQDGLSDQLEQDLAEKFAPIVFHDPSEPNLPTSVELFLPQTELWTYDDHCQPMRKIVTDQLTISIPIAEQRPCHASDDVLESHGTRSENKNRTFFLKNVSKTARAGSLEPGNWTTYFHCYPNEDGGVTIQYWRFYVYNTGQFLGLHAIIGDHGGDWEAVHVVLNSNYTPVAGRFLGHRHISTRNWTDLSSEGSHLLVKSEKGGHTSVPFKAGERPKSALIRQETWSGGKITCPRNSRYAQLRATESVSPPLINLGEKTAPATKMEFIQFSGLWGTRQSTWFFSRLRSGYWGPANNETGMHRDYFIAAWCDGMANSLRNRSVSSNSRTIRECYPNKAGR
jgi:hypothetical protein